METLNDQFFAKNSNLSIEFSKYVLEHPEIDELLTDDTTVIFLPEFDTDVRDFNLKIAKEIESQGGRLLYVRVKGMMEKIPTRLVGVEINAADKTRRLDNGV